MQTCHWQDRKGTPTSYRHILRDLVSGLVLDISPWLFHLDDMKLKYLFLVWLLYQADARWTTNPAVESRYTQDITSRKSWSTYARDWLVESIWPHVTSHTITQEAFSPDPFQLRPPSRLRAKFGDDLVLRFRLQSRSEAETLASAIRILFLDTWESNSAFVDIRISSDVVGPSIG